LDAYPWSATMIDDKREKLFRQMVHELRGIADTIRQKDKWSPVADEAENNADMIENILDAPDSVAVYFEETRQ
jgi:hypothetical protein